MFTCLGLDSLIAYKYRFGKLSHIPLRLYFKKNESLGKCKVGVFTKPHKPHQNRSQNGITALHRK